MSFLRTLFPMLFTGGAAVAEKVHKAPLTAICDLKDGARLKVSGVVLDTTATRPALLSGAAAVCTRTIIDVAFGRTNGWMHLVDQFHSQPFSLRDDTGEVLVDSRHIKLAGVVDSDSHNSMSEADRHALSEILAASQFGFTAWHKNFEFLDGRTTIRGVRVRETILAPGDRASVLGAVRREVSRTASQQETGYRSMATQPVLRGSRRRPVLVLKER